VLAVVVRALLCEILDCISCLTLAAVTFENWIMLRIAERLDFLATIMVKVCHKLNNQPPNLCFYNFSEQ
ncbi:MAG: hypothetical protein ACYSSI_12465, partial [Planctomycetota bacterium]